MVISNGRDATSISLEGMDHKYAYMSNEMTHIKLSSLFLKLPHILSITLGFSSYVHIQHRLLGNADSCHLLLLLFSTYAVYKVLEVVLAIEKPTKEPFDKWTCHDILLSR